MFILFTGLYLPRHIFLPSLAVTTAVRGAETLM